MNRRMTYTKRIAAGLLTAVIVLTSLLMQVTPVFAEEMKDLPKKNCEKVIAHGGGAYKGLETTNSVEALNAAIINGYKLIELDMELSSDQKIIMLHDWDRTAMHYYGAGFDERISQSKFLNLSVYGKLEVLTFEKLAKIMEKHQDFKIVTDTKGDNLELLTKISKEYPELVSRIIPQIYDYGQWNEAKTLGYTDIIFTLYALPDLDTQKLIAFVKEHELYAVTMPDYLAEKGYCSQLSKKGISVYVHPVSNFEDAQKFMEMGAYGVYSGTLLPEEFEGIEKDYYLIRPNEEKEAKLTDERIRNLTEFKLHGLKFGDFAVFSIDDSRQSISQQELADLESGKHKLTVRIFNQKYLLGSLDYILWKDENNYRILHKKYEYRLDSVKQEKGFDDVMKQGNVPKDIAEILEHSLIAKKGEYIFFSDGNPKYYMNGEEFFPVQKGSSWKLLLPLNTTLKNLGASSVTMSRTRDVSIVYNNDKYMVVVNSYIIRKGFQTTRINSPVVLYLNKAMAGGEFYRCITGRSFIEKDDTIVILPEGVKADSAAEKQIIKAAGTLF
ncbi:MAG: glycerophosphodiester phosphodiesterase family protein [Bacillota bacterium]